MTQAGVVTVLVEALERLGARIDRDLNVEAGEAAAPEDARWAATLSSFVAFADECMEVLDDPRVVSALSPTS
jgi:hypothetical protein